MFKSYLKHEVFFGYQAKLSLVNTHSFSTNFILVKQNLKRELQ
jgi:hypothetical protein